MATKTAEARPAPALVAEMTSIALCYARAVQSLRDLFKSMKVAEDKLKEIGAPVPDAIALYTRIYTVHEKMTEIVKHTEALKGIFGKGLVPEAMDLSQTKTLTISEGHRVTRTDDKIYASIPAEKRPAAYQWLRDHEAGDLIQETVNASTLSAYVKSLREKNEDVPDDLFTVLEVPAVSLTRAKGWKLEETY